MGSISYENHKLELVCGKTVFDYADELSVQVPTSCGRTGTCHECIVEINRGMEALSGRNDTEMFLRGNYRLACQSWVENPEIDVHFSLLRRRPQILTVNRPKPLQLDPCVRRQGDQVWLDDDVIDRFRGHVYGLAVDLGTTTIVVELVDLESGESVSVHSFENPQRFGGSDVMHRISYDGGPFRGELSKAAINAVHGAIREMSRQLGFATREIYEVVVAGNSTMRDLFFKLDVQSIGQRPYKSMVEHEFREGKRSTTALSEEARRLGLQVNPKARIYGLPLVASHVGADTAADLVAIGMEAQREVVMLVDVGTNTEVVVGHQGRMLAASCPAGPAFEGGLVKFGMPGCEGAIESIRMVGERFEFETIGDAAPQGICGSGLIDLLAELRRNGLMTPKGVFSNKRFEIPVAPDFGITLSREDASNLAQAKAANYCGQFIVMRQFGVSPGDITRLYLAGAFANYVNVRNAIDIGFLAPVPEDRIVKIGNASVQGAKEILLSRRKRETLESLIKRIEHVELETTPDFFDVFVEGCQFKPMPGAFVSAGAPQ
jgi:uncharacterized 2Fe-2S/4Fe-4S cluster protein (DUF4445 family)